MSTPFFPAVNSPDPNPSEICFGLLERVPLFFARLLHHFSRAAWDCTMLPSLWAQIRGNTHDTSVTSDGTTGPTWPTAARMGLDGTLMDKDCRLFPRWSRSMITILLLQDRLGRGGRKTELGNAFSCSDHCTYGRGMLGEINGCLKIRGRG